MNDAAKSELYQIKRELQSIINELDTISQEVRNGFEGIGNEECAACVKRVADHYRGVKRRLEKIDTTKVREEFAAAGGGT